jgi:hypothetical protein
MKLRHAAALALGEGKMYFLIALILGFGLFILGDGLRPLLLSVGLMVYGALGVSIGRLRKQIAEDASRMRPNPTEPAEHGDPPGGDEAARQVEGLELQARFWKWAAYALADLARQAVAKYGSAKSPPASPLLDTRAIMETWERMARGFAAPFTLPPGESLLAAITPLAQMEALERTTGRTAESAMAAMLPYTTAEFEGK